MARVTDTAPGPADLVYEIVGDVSTLPDHAFGMRSIIFWGTFSFMLIEGIGFVLAGGAYLYLMGQNAHWPPLGTYPPNLLWGTLLAVLMCASVIPNIWLDKHARRCDLGRARFGLLVMSAIALLCLVIRAMEFPVLNTRWDVNAYGSIVWALMLLHTLHLLTDAADTWVLTAFMFRHDVDAERFGDVEDNAGYWDFVVLSWIPIYALIYWAPRVM